jgi:hypothetical protein
MKTWLGLAGDVAAISDGAQFIRNCSFDVEGELRRRIALERVQTTAGRLGMTTYGAPIGNQYVVLVTSTGTVEMLSA